MLNQPGSVPEPNVHPVVYPWGMPQNFVPQTANEGAFIPYQSMTVPTVNGNYIAYPWGIPPHLSP